MQLVNNGIVSFIIWLRSERGQDLLEYAMLGGLIAAAILVVFGVLVAGGNTSAIGKLANGIAKCIDFDNSVTSECKGGL